MRNFMVVTNQNKKKLILLVVIVFAILYFINLSGFTIKKAKVGAFYAISVPTNMPDLHKGEHYVSIYVFKIDAPFENEKLRSSWRRGFKGMYWEQGEERLWVYDERGISVYEIQDGRWGEYIARKTADGTVEMIIELNGEEIKLEQYTVPHEIQQ